MFHVKQEAAAALEQLVSRETVEMLREYVALLLHWNRRINLVGARDEATLWQRHVLDSLQLAALLPARAARGIDLGSGAGFPGLVLAAACRVPFDLVESDQRKAAFLHEAARRLDVPVAVHAVRIEQARLPPAPLVTARALAPLDRLLTLAAPLLAPGGTCLFPKGETACNELTEAAKQWQMEVERVPSRTHERSVILRIRDPRRAPSAG